jgi:hypothetical protein
MRYCRLLATAFVARVVDMVGLQKKKLKKATNKRFQIPVTPSRQVRTSSQNFFARAPAIYLKIKAEEVV